jgi:alcohol dehydrogenase
MKAWVLEKLGGSFLLKDVPKPEARPGSVVVRVETSALMSYMRDYVHGKLPVYQTPQGPFIPGGNATGRIESVGHDVWHLRAGQRVILSSHFVAAENVADPAQILIGITAVGPMASRMQADWRDGTLAEYTVWPASGVTPAENLDKMDPAQLAVTMRYIVPYGGLLRGRLSPGETLIVSGATGSYRTAAVLLALALGAARVIALGRNQKALDALAAVSGDRVVPVAVTGNLESDIERVKSGANGGAHVAFDMVGGATDPNATLTALRSLRRGGRLVLMGSMSAPLPISYLDVMLNNWEILGQFMYTRESYSRLLDLIRSGILDPTKIEPVIYPLDQLGEAINKAAEIENLQCVIVRHGTGLNGCS